MLLVHQSQWELTLFCPARARDAAPCEHIDGPLGVRALEMARVAMRVRDLKKLEVGDLVPLGALESALLRINGRPVLAAEPGRADGQRSIRVFDRVR